MTNYQPSFRANLITRRTYNRPLDNGKFETWAQTTDRVIQHQKWLWERAQNKKLDFMQQMELEELRELMLARKATVSGRTLWLGGTDVAKTREASQFNCSFSYADDVYSIVDQFWLLLQGCGVGFKPITGVLNGFTNEKTITVIRSKKVLGDPKGYEKNKAVEYAVDGTHKVWHLTIGDSAEAWAKAVGKILAYKGTANEVILDFSEIRAAGERLKGYGWISSGDEMIAKAFVAICKLLNGAAGRLLSAIDILDILNHLGMTLSSRRSAEIALLDANDPEADDFIYAKKDFYLVGNDHRGQSNNTIIFWDTPSRTELEEVFRKMVEAGGSEPGFYNGAAAKKRGPWFKGTNPCAEILLGDKSFCNLVEIDWGKFLTDPRGLTRAIWIAARANYRQTCVNLKDGVLSDSWHELNEFLRLCGVGATGIVKWLDGRSENAYSGDDAVDLEQLKLAAHLGADGMADELGLPRAKAVTTVKPSGTLSKIMDTTEGVHKPLGKYIFNNVMFGKHDPLVQKLRWANYTVIDHPLDPSGVLVRLPTCFEDVEFDLVELETGWCEVNLETAVSQLERYKLMMDHYVDHNCSVTISYDPTEVPAIIDWLEENWDTYVGVSWLFRNDPTNTAADLGYAYLPQEVVTKEAYYKELSKLLPVNLDDDTGEDLIDADCSTGACPVR